MELLAYFLVLGVIVAICQLDFANRPKGSIKLVICGSACALVVGGLCTFRFWTEDQLRITVTEKERVTTGRGTELGSKYLVWAEGETFELKDDWLHGVTDASDTYGRMKVGQAYDVKVTGWRVPILSWHRNIYHAEAAQ